MRNKQAKALRKQARTSGAAQETTYTVEYFNKYYTDLLTGTLKKYKVATLSLDVCQRSVYKELKKNFKSKA